MTKFIDPTKLDNNDNEASGGSAPIGQPREYASSEPSEELDAIVRSVIGAGIEVHRCLGPGFLESVYETAICVELDRRGISYERQMRVPIMYKGAQVGEHIVDLVVEGELLVELKTVAAIAPIHIAQVISYLKATELQLGLLLNFFAPRLSDGGIKRIVHTSN